MIKTFTATSISVEDDGLMTLAVFNEQDDYLFFQCPIEQKDWDTGVYVEFNDQHHGGYDVVSSIDLNLSQLSVALKSPLLGLPDVDGFEIALDCEADAVRAFAHQLVAGFKDRLATVNCQLS